VSVRSDILLWAQRTVAKKGAQAHQLLDIDAEAGLDEAQAAFHRIARMAHPDLHRAMLTPEEHELVTLAYSRITGAYQDFRSQRMQTTRLRPVHEDAGIPVPDSPASPPPTVSGASGAMTSKALIYYRKAELALRRGDLKGAILQLKMAIAADPVSPVLRTALGEVEAEVGKKP
jgi:hypothetical protein